ncbi:hypothetical protein DL766_005471 [Monosporascus sp. MC13-8B]|nr:hypothetical protein DL763_000863 [Monosporascus cannonballus]RYP29260.1 hypothetical protein DL766_005471 [Monosporascus sp. MC13-8B]
MEKPGLSPSAQKLPNEVLWQVAKHFLHRPRDVLALALTIRDIGKVLQPELLITDTLFTKEQQLREEDMDKRRRDGSGDAQLSKYRDCLLTGDTRQLADDARETIISFRRALPRRQSVVHQLISQGKTEDSLQYIKHAMVYWLDHLDLPDEGGYPPLHLAAMRGNTDIVRVLVEAGSFVSAKVRLSSIHYKFPGSDKLNWIIYYDTSPSGNCLSLAILHGHEDLALWSIRNTSLGHECGTAKVRPLHAAAFAKSKSIAEVLLKDGCDPNYQVRVDLSVSPLHLAAASPDNAGVIQLLIDRGARLDILDGSFEIPLHYAVQYGDPPNCDPLLSAGSDPVAEDSELENVLDYASRKDSALSVTKRLIPLFETEDVFRALIKAYTIAGSASESFRTRISELQERRALEKKELRTLRQELHLRAPQSQQSERDMALVREAMPFSRYHQLCLCEDIFNLAGFEYLLDSGWVDIEERDEYSHAFLSDAVAMNNSEAARALLLRGADREAVLPDSHREQLRQWEVERKMTGPIWPREEASKSA